MTVLVSIAAGAVIGAALMFAWFYCRNRWLRIALVDEAMRILKPVKMDVLGERDARTLQAYRDLEKNTAFILVKRDIYLTYLLDNTEGQRSVPDSDEAVFRSGERGAASHMFILAQMARKLPVTKEIDDAEAE